MTKNQVFTIDCANIIPRTPKAPIVPYLAAIGFPLFLNTMLSRVVLDLISPYFMPSSQSIPSDFEKIAILVLFPSVFFWLLHVVTNSEYSNSHSIGIDCSRQAFVRTSKLSGLRISRRVFYFKNVERIRHIVKDWSGCDEGGLHYTSFIPIIYVMLRSQPRKKRVEQKLCCFASMRSPDNKTLEHTKAFEEFLEQIIVHRPPSPVDLLQSPRFRTFSEQWTRNAEFRVKVRRRWIYSLILAYVISFCTLPLLTA